MMPILPILICILYITQLPPNVLPMFGRHIMKSLFRHHGHGSNSPAAGDSSCGKFPLKAMEDFKAADISGSAVINLWKAKFPNNDSIQNVFTGYLGDREKNFSIKNCVTVKVTDKNVPSEMKLFEHNMKIFGYIKERFKTKPTERNLRIIDVLDFGKMQHFSKEGVANEYRLTVMESTHPVKNSNIISNESNNLSQEKFTNEEIAKFAHALKALHEIDILHLDVKRDNFAYANGADGPETVKLVNFDRSLIVPEGEIKTHDPSRSYIEVSQLNDMKAFGKLIYETYIVEARNLVTPEIRKYNLDHFAAIFSNEIGVGKKRFDITADWLLESEENANSLKYLLEIRKNFPRIFLLIQILMEIDMYMVMSAEGVLEFLKNTCKPMKLPQNFSRRMSEAELVKILRKDGLKALLDIMDDGTAPYKEAIEKMQKQKLPECHCVVDGKKKRGTD